MSILLVEIHRNVALAATSAKPESKSKLAKKDGVHVAGTTKGVKRGQHMQ